MKIGIKKPSIKKSIKARTTGKAKRAIKSAINPMYGKKGTGLITNPKKAVYNKVYNKTTIGISDLNKSQNSTKSSNNIQVNNKKIYKIINQDKVLINNKTYSKKTIKNTFIFISILFALSGFITLPIGIIFILLSLFMFSMYKTYKTIYYEMENYEEEN